MYSDASGVGGGDESWSYRHQIKWEMKGVSEQIHLERNIWMEYFQNWSFILFILVLLGNNDFEIQTIIALTLLSWMIVMIERLKMD